MSGSEQEKRRLERARERVQKAAARRRVEKKAARNKKQREKAKSRQRIERGEPDGARESAVVAGREAKALASDAGELAETAPGASSLKKLASKGAAVASSAVEKASGGSEGGGKTLRERLQARSSSKPIQLESGYDEEGGTVLGYYRAGEDGQKFYYVPGNERSRAKAKQAARDQLPKPGDRGGGKPSFRELVGQASVEESFVSLGTRAEYDPAPPVRSNTEELQPRAGFGFGPGMGGGLDFQWGGAPADEREASGGMDFQWGEEAEESESDGIGFDWSDDDDDGAGSGGIEFKW